MVRSLTCIAMGEVLQDMFSSIAAYFEGDDSHSGRLCQRISLSLLYANRLRHPQLNTTDLIHQFETNYPISILEGVANRLSILTDLGQTVSHAKETLDIARTDLEIPILQNLILAETLANP